MAAIWDSQAQMISHHYSYLLINRKKKQNKTGEYFLGEYSSSCNFNHSETRDLIWKNPSDTITGNMQQQ